MGFFRGGDEILPNLDQEPGEAARGDLLMQRVARQGTVIGLVVADDQAAVFQRRDQRQRQARIGVPQNADLPGPLRAAPIWRERMQAKPRRDSAPWPMSAAIVSAMAAR